MSDFTGAGARAAASDGRLEQWVHDGLRGPGDNLPMSEGLRVHRRWWIGPVRVPVELLVLKVGPEPGMPYPEDRTTWDRRVGAIAESLDRGWDAPPLIVEPMPDDRLLIADGSHRFEARRRRGEAGIEALIFFDDPERWNAFRPGWAPDAPRIVGAEVRAGDGRP